MKPVESGDSVPAPFERRSGADRRRRSSFPPRFSPLRRRLRSGRRNTDCGYVDRYDARTWGLALSVLILSTLDAVLTGLQISQGRGREANPLMALAIDHGGMWTFYSVKAAMTAFPLMILVIHKEWKAAKYAARVCLYCYLAVSVYHLYLMLLT
jgi:hypothetical protein